MLLISLASCGGGGGSASSTPPGPNNGAGAGGGVAFPPSNTAPVVTSAESIIVLSGASGAIYTATATDAENDGLSFSITGDDAARFAIGTATGTLSFNTPPDVATPSHANRDNEYRITVTVSDGRASSSRGVSVQVVGPGQGVMRNLTSLELAREMSPGWNLGNTLEAMPDETGWGNPLATQTLMNAVKAAGFKTVRIPVSGLSIPMPNSTSARRGWRESRGPTRLTSTRSSRR